MKRKIIPIIRFNWWVKNPMLSTKKPAAKRNAAILQNLI
jgi:hypothetical protein